MNLIISILSKVYRCVRQTNALIIIIILACSSFLQIDLLLPVATAQVIDLPDQALRSSLESALDKQAGEDITQEDMASLLVFDAFESGIRNISGLEFAVNLTILRLGLNQISDISQLEGLKKLTVLDLHRNKLIVNVEPLKDLANLTWLSLRGNSITNLSPLSGLTKLTYLHVAYNLIRDISPIATLTNLTFLDIEVNRVSDLTPVSGLTNLTYLDFDSTKVSDLTPIGTLINLTELDASDCQISDISSIRFLTKLTYLDLDDNQISNISALSEMTSLMRLDLDDNQILDITPLEDMTELTWLDIDHSSISDLTPIQNLWKLEYLDLNDNIVSDLTPLRNLTNLTELDLDSNTITDISPIRGLTKLKILDLHGNKIKNISALSRLINLTDLDLDDNEIIDVSPLRYLTALTILDLDGNMIIDISPLNGLTQLTVLDLHDNHISDFSPIAGIVVNLADYDASGQTDPPSDLIVEPTFNIADVNRDGVVNIADLAVIAGNFHETDLDSLTESNIFPDVNSDGIINIIDLLIVAAEISSDVDAPPLHTDYPGISYITSKNLRQWIQLSKHLALNDQKLEVGVAFLEQLLEVVVQDENQPKVTAILRNYPNPFNPDTWIPYQLAEPAEVNVYIFSTDGKLVRRLQLGHLSIGKYHSKERAAYWNGRNNLGESVASGLYLYHFTADNFTASGKMLLSK